jgi:arylsulfatase A-like enzyme
MRRNNGTVLHGQLPGFLGAKHMHFAVDQKLTGNDVRVEAVQPADDLTSIRLSARRDLLRQFDAQRRLIDESATARRFDVFTQKAFSLLSSPATRKAFDLAAESPATRARYGDTEFGQRCLLARRLAEAGVPMVNVSYCHTPRGSWDTHSRNFTQMKRALAPTLDTAFSALLDDLADRRLLDDTLVIVNAEFGRTPKINRNAGRDHWPWVYSLCLAGAGIRPGVVYGASDNSAAYPTAHPHDPADMAATIYHLLGVDPKTTLYDKLRRPHRLVIGKPIGAILG